MRLISLATRVLISSVYVYTMHGWTLKWFRFLHSLKWEPSFEWHQRQGMTAPSQQKPSQSAMTCHCLQKTLRIEDPLALQIASYALESLHVSQVPPQSMASPILSNHALHVTPALTMCAAVWPGAASQSWLNRTYRGIIWQRFELSFFSLKCGATNIAEYQSITSCKAWQVELPISCCKLDKNESITLYLLYMWLGGTWMLYH